jgi:gentisate 1,2-dioxygenase
VLAIQYLLPGEVAPAHRHSPTAIRFMLHGEGAFTTVDGQKCAMKAGDLVLTPGMAWHDHGNEGGKPVYWMDILDWQIVRFLENLTFEPYPEEQQPALRSPGRDIYFPWAETYATLLERAKQAPDPFDDVLQEYVDPASGGSLVRRSPVICSFSGRACVHAPTARPARRSIAWCKDAGRRRSTIRRLSGSRETSS